MVEERSRRRLSAAGSHGWVTDRATSARLSRQKQSGTTPELAVRTLVREAGARYRISNRDLPGSPDLANRRRRWAIFVHGCFWHAHEGCVRATLPKRNRTVWRAKFQANRRRDALKRSALVELGYRVCVLWECEVCRPGLVRARLRKFLGKRGG